MHNAARLRVLKAREDHVGTVLDEAKKRLAEIIKDRDVYKKLINTLMSQGLLQVCFVRRKLDYFECEEIIRRFIIIFYVRVH
jgi:hypothetical protein